MKSILQILGEEGVLKEERLGLTLTVEMYLEIIESAKEAMKRHTEQFLDRAITDVDFESDQQIIIDLKRQIK